LKLKEILKGSYKFNTLDAHSKEFLSEIVNYKDKNGNTPLMLAV